MVAATKVMIPLDATSRSLISYWSEAWGGHWSVRVAGWALSFDAVHWVGVEAVSAVQRQAH